MLDGEGDRIVRKSYAALTRQAIDAQKHLSQSFKELLKKVVRAV